jgi:hypothetical protein
MRIKRILSVLLCCFLLLDLLGCEAFTRKFTRKSKKSAATVEMVLVPEEYKGPDMTKEEIYRQYYLYWNSWQEELITALNQQAGLKKKIDCAQEALKNLVNMKMMLVADAQKYFDPQIAKFNELLADLKSDPYGVNDRGNILAAEHLKSSIHKNFIYPKIRNYLK